MSEEPDFQALAQLWLQRDQRAESLSDPEKNRIAQRLAEALKHRRQAVDPVLHEVDLVVHVPREEISDEGTLSSQAIEQLAQFLQERLPESSSDNESSENV